MARHGGAERQAWARHEDARRRLSPDERRILDRVGASPGEALEWLLRFAALDLDALTEGDWLSLQEECVGFLRGDPLLLTPYPKPPLRRRRGSAAFLQAGALMRFSLPTGQPPGPLRALLPSREEIRSLQAQTREALDTLLETDRVELPADKLTWVVTRVVAPAGWDPDNPKAEPFAVSWVRLQGGSYSARMAYWLAYYLGEFGSQLTRCAECGRVFPAARPWQRFCSARCQSRHTSRAFRERRQGRPPNSTRSKTAGRRTRRHQTRRAR